jgi:hypothetical protein
MLLLTDAGERTLKDVVTRSKVYNLAEDAAFESLFVNNLYLQPMQALDSNPLARLRERG